MNFQLDLRELTAPEPMERILDALEQLPRGQRLSALTPFRPVPLLPILDAQGFAWEIEDTASGHASITIWHRDDPLLSAALP